MEEYRLGDIIDDYCTRCRLLTNHSIVALLGEEVKKVRCRTCHHEHDFRHGKGGRKKTQKLSAYEQVLASVLSGKMAGSSLKQKKPDKPSRSSTPSARRARPTRTRPHSSR